MARGDRRFSINIWTLLLVPIGLWIGAAGGADLSWGLRRLAKLERLGADAALVAGIVVRVEPLPWGRLLTLGRRGQRRELIRYRFRISGGEIIESADTLTLPGLKTFDPGREVQISYRRSHPNANLISERNAWLDTVLITAFGAVGVVTGIFFVGCGIVLVYLYLAWRTI